MIVPARIEPPAPSSARVLPPRAIWPIAGRLSPVTKSVPLLTVLVSESVLPALTFRLPNCTVLLYSDVSKSMLELAVTFTALE